MAVSHSPAWVADAVFYQIFPDRFARSDRLVKPPGLESWDDPPTVHGYKGGDLLGVVERLDWITGIGANALYLNPIFQSAANHRYHTHDYYRVDPLLGGEAAFDELVAACHRRRMRIVLDGVFNHASRGFFQFHDLLENGPKSPWEDWFVVHDWPLRAYDRDGDINYDAWWGLPALPKFNTDNPQVREYLMEVGEYWVRRGIDGWRLDVPGEITTPGFWEEFRERTRAINPDLYLVGELWGDASDWITRGDRFDATMNYRFTAAATSFVANRRIDLGVTKGVSYDLTTSMDAAGYAAAIGGLLASYPEAATRANLNLLGSHDTPRLVTVARDDRNSVLLANLLLFTFPGAPCIYYGDEIGLAGGADPDNRRAFPWDHARDWDEAILSTVKELAELRRTQSALRTTGYRTVWPPPDEPGRMLHAFVRGAPGDEVLVAVNAGDATEVAPISNEALGGAVPEPLWGQASATPGEHVVRLSVGSRRGAMWRLRRPAAGDGRAQEPAHPAGDG